ncbi:MAG TPA: GNAT family N-acetyltransferase [Candidatus Saccharimonadales bacterium]|nr:GNAT family N-acetyltransferase [Candidatus Saccharimonadales bacterium]
MSIEFTGDKAAYTRAILEASPPRNATLEDVEAIAALDRTIFASYGPTMGRWRIADAIRQNPAGMQVLELDGNLAGTIYGQLIESPNFEGRAYGEVTSIGIAEEYRGRGIGELLFGRMVQAMLDEQEVGTVITGISLYTRAGNLAMQQLAEKYDFTVEQTVPSFYEFFDPPEDAYLMVLVNPASDHLSSK